MLVRLQLQAFELRLREEKKDKRNKRLANEMDRKGHRAPKTTLLAGLWAQMGWFLLPAIFFLLRTVATV
jgi:hypothetical protein